MVWTRCATAEDCAFMVSMPQMIKAAFARQDNRRALPISIECASSCPRSSLVSQSDAPAAAWSSPTLWAKRQEPPTSSLCILSTLHVSSIPSPSEHAICLDKKGEFNRISGAMDAARVRNYHRLHAPAMVCTVWDASGEAVP